MGSLQRTSPECTNVEIRDKSPLCLQQFSPVPGSTTSITHKKCMSTLPRLRAGDSLSHLSTALPLQHKMWQHPHWKLQCLIPLPQIPEHRQQPVPGTLHQPLKQIQHFKALKTAPWDTTATLKIIEGKHLLLKENIYFSPLCFIPLNERLRRYQVMKPPEQKAQVLGVLTPW